MSVQTISATDFCNLFNSNKDMCCIDVRTNEEFNALHVKGVSCRPLHIISSNDIETSAKQKNLADKDPIYLICQKGTRAKMAAEALQGAGLENIVCVSDGGMQRWTDMGWPVAK